MRLTQQHPDWVLGFSDETWWSRFAQPSLHSWQPRGQPVRLTSQSVPRSMMEPKALACYGLLLRTATTDDQLWLRFVEGRPVSDLTTQFLAWCVERLEALGKRVLVLVWDNAGWHISHVVRRWIRAHNQHAKQTRHGCRILAYRLPSQSPWLNPIEPHWVHGKRAVVEPTRLLSSEEIEQRVCAYYGCAHESRLTISNEAL